HVHGWPGVQAGMAQPGEWPAAGSYGVPQMQSPYMAGYGMPPQHAAANPYGGMMPMAHPAAGGCPCGWHQRFEGGEGAAAGSGEAAAQPEAEQAGSRKSSKKAARTSGGSGARARISGSASAARRTQPVQKRGSRPWINR